MRTHRLVSCHGHAVYLDIFRNGDRLTARLRIVRDSDLSLVRTVWRLPFTINERGAVVQWANELGTILVAKYYTPVGGRRGDA